MLFSAFILSKMKTALCNHLEKKVGYGSVTVRLRFGYGTALGAKKSVRVEFGAKICGSILVSVLYVKK